MLYSGPDANFLKGGTTFKNFAGGGGGEAGANLKKILILMPNGCKFGFWRKTAWLLNIFQKGGTFAPLASPCVWPDISAAFKTGSDVIDFKAETGPVFTNNMCTEIKNCPFGSCLNIWNTFESNFCASSETHGYTIPLLRMTSALNL